MTNKKLIWNFINLLFGLLILAYLAKTMHWFKILSPFRLYHFIICAAVIFGLRSWFESKYDVDNLVKNNRTTKAIFFFGGGVFILGAMFKVMHWPGGSLLSFLGGLTVVTSFIISFFLNPDTEEKSNSDILDDI